MAGKRTVPVYVSRTKGTNCRRCRDCINRTNDHRVPDALLGVINAENKPGVWVLKTVF